MEKTDSYYIDKMIEDMNFIVNHTKEISQEELENEDIPWTDIYGLRNRIVHDYGNVDISVVYDTLKEDIPDLLEKIKNE